jgi:hypothetical protein
MEQADFEEKSINRNLPELTTEDYFGADVE